MGNKIIKEKNIEEVLKYYGINEKISTISFLCENYYIEKMDFRIRVISKVKTIDEKIYIIKFIFEEEHPYELIEEQSIFSECLRNNGIETAKQLKYKDNYCYLYSIDDIKLNVTIQEYIGEEVEFLTEDIIKKTAMLMAKMHKISEQYKCHIGNDTIWNIFNDNTDIMRGYIKFNELYKVIIDIDENNYKLVDNINKIYIDRKMNIERIKNKLPKYATQGDFSINNLTYENDKLGIFDYNIAGDEFLIVDMIVEGLFITKVMDLSKTLSDEDRTDLFKLFVKTYIKYRKITNDEFSILNDIYAIIVPFWWSRIIFDEKESLVSILNDKNKVKLKSFLEETQNILQSNYFMGSKFEV